MLNIPCVIFAGGKSSRMGEDKALLPFGGFDTLAEFQQTRLKKIFKTIYISCKDKTNFTFKANFIEDIKTNDIFAPTTGFISVFDSLACEKIFVLSVDTPFINEQIIETLLKADNPNAEATIAKLNGKMQPMCGIYHHSLREKFTQMLETDNHKLGLLLKNSKTTFVNFNDEKPFLNLNHPHQYQEALTLI